MKRTQSALISIAVTAIFLSGCADKSTLLRNADGKIMECAASGFGVLGAPAAIIDHDRCVERAKTNGFSPVKREDS